MDRFLLNLRVSRSLMAVTVWSCRLSFISLELFSVSWFVLCSTRDFREKVLEMLLSEKLMVVKPVDLITCSYSGAKVGVGNILFLGLYLLPLKVSLKEAVDLPR